MLTMLLRRVAPAFLLWLAIYWSIDLVRFADPEALDFSLAGFASALWTGGDVSYHLWYLPALIVGAAIVLALNAWLGAGIAVLVGLALYAVGVAIGAYGKFWGVEISMSLYRNGVLFAPVFLVMGIWLRQHEARVRAIVPAVAVLAVVASARLQMMEGDMLMQAAGVGVEPFRRDFGIPTVAFGVSVVVLFMTVRVPGRFWTRLGGMTFAGYLIHLLVMRLVAPRFDAPPPQWLFVAIAAVTTFAAVFAFQALRDGWRVVTKRVAPAAG